MLADQICECVTSGPSDAIDLTREVCARVPLLDTDEVHLATVFLLSTSDSVLTAGYKGWG